MSKEKASSIGGCLITAAEPNFDRRNLLRGLAVAGVAAAGALPPSVAARAEVWEEGDAQCRPQIQEVTPSYPLDDALLADFVKLSEILTGVKPLDHQLGSQYLDRYARHPDLTALVLPLINGYRGIMTSGGTASVAAVDSAIMQTSLRPAAEQLIYLWYVSAFFLPLGGDPTQRKWVYGAPEQYERSLLWNVVHAHPPMTHGGQTGYWAKSPV